MVNKFRGSSFRSSSSNIHHPKFCQIISSSDELCRLRIPVEFTSNHCKDMLNPVFLEAPYGKAWEVEVEHSQGEIWLAEGWKEFCNYYSISIRNFLIFKYNARAHFDVTIFGLGATEIEYPMDETESDDSMDISDDSAEEDDFPVNLQTNANVIEDDIPVNLQTNASVHEEEESQDREVGETNSRCEKAGPNNSSRHSLVNLNGDSPYFEIVIKKSHTTSMTIPLRFAVRTDIINMKNMRLANEDGIEWGVEIEYNGRMVIIKRGWTEFRKHNKIVSGETCRFKLIQGHAANVLQVLKIPTPQSLQ